MKRLGRKQVSVSALGLVLVMSVAVLGLWVLLREDEHALPRRHAPATHAGADAVERPTLLAIAPVAARLAAPLAPADVADSTSETQLARGKAKRSRRRRREAKAKTKATARPGVLRGTVVDKHGVGVADARVTVRPRRGRRGKETATDPTGAFELSLDPGRYRVMATKRGHAKCDRPWVRIRAGGTATLDPLVLRPACTLTGIVRSQGVPVAGAKISVDGQGNAVTDAAGQFVVEDLREGLYTVRAKLAAHVPQRHRNVPVTENAGGEAAFDLVRGGRLTGVLRQDAGAPLERGLVFVYRDGRRLGTARSDADGRFQVDGLSAGPVDLFARSVDYGRSIRSATEIAAGKLNAADLTLLPSPRIEGVLRDAQGQPVQGREVRARSVAGDVRRKGKSDAQGRFVIKNLYAGRYTLRIYARGAREPIVREELEVTAGRTERDLVLPAGGTISGRVVDVRGKAVPKANVFAIVGAQYRGQTPTNAAGEFSIRNLPADDYRIFVRVGNDRLVGLHGLTLAEGGVVSDLQLLARAPARLHGRVFDPQGKPVAGLAIDVRGGSSPVRRRATTGPDGTYVIAPLYDGDYRVSARAGPLALLAKKWGVATASVAPFTFLIEQGRDVKRDLVVKTQQ